MNSENDTELKTGAARDKTVKKYKEQKTMMKRMIRSNNIYAFYLKVVVQVVEN